MNRKKQAQTELSYYGLYLLNHLRENRFPQASDADFIRERADHAFICSTSQRWMTCTI